MSIKQVWLNLPVKNMSVSKTFFKEIGFTPNPMHENNPQAGSFFIGEQKMVMMLFPEELFARFCRHTIADTSKGCEILINIDAQSREEVDAMAALVKKAGGSIFAEPGEADGWMYAFGFADPDGHRWSMLYMDMNNMPKH